MELSYRNLKIIKQRLIDGDKVEIIAYENKISKQRVYNLFHEFMHFLERKKMDKEGFYDYFSIRTINALREANLLNREKILHKFEKDPVSFLCLRNLGKESFNQVSRYYNAIKCKKGK